MSTFGLAVCELSQTHCNSARKRSLPRPLTNLKTLLSTAFKPLLQELENTKIISCTTNKFSLKMLNNLFDATFQFIDQPYLPSQNNFAPVDEIGEPVEVSCVQGKIPFDFPEGVYMRNGPNPLFGALKSVKSVFGRTDEVWIEGDGMIHALYLTKDSTNGDYKIRYKNKFVETSTFKIENKLKKPLLLPIIEGDSFAVLLALILNLIRFGVESKILSNTNVFEHAGKYYSIAENYLPQEIDVFSLKTLGNYNLNGAWRAPFTAHPKKDPISGEMVIMRFSAFKPYYVVGVISADGKKLNHEVDIKLERPAYTHDIGITQKYNVIIDHPLIASISRLCRGGQFIKFEKEKYTRLGVMPRYGDANTIKWFDIKTYCIFHLFNCFEDGDEVVVRGCKAKEAIIPGPDWGDDKFKWFSRGFNFKKISKKEVDITDSTTTEDGFLFASPHEWRLNMKTGKVKKKNVTENEYSMDFPFINESFVSLRNKYGYTQVLDSIASSHSGKTKYGSLAKLYFDQPEVLSSLDKRELVEKEVVRTEIHHLGKNKYCTGATFVTKKGAIEEDDGWILAFVHDEDKDTSQVIIIDAKKFEENAVAKINIPQRVPYGFHGAFFPISARDSTC